MAKSKSARGLSRRRRRSQAQTGETPDHVHAEAAADVTATLQQISRAREQDQLQADRRKPNVPVALGVNLRGTSVVNHGLVSGSDSPDATEVIAVHAAVHPEQPDCLAIRVDGWNGHLVLILPRDRAVLLAKKLEQAIEHSRSMTVRRSSPVPEPTDLIVDLNQNPVRGAKHMPLPSKRGGRQIQDLQGATDRALERLVQIEPAEND